jgi:hypothetical protein
MKELQETEYLAGRSLHQACLHHRFNAPGEKPFGKTFWHGEIHFGTDVI